MARPQHTQLTGPANSEPGRLHQDNTPDRCATGPQRRFSMGRTGPWLDKAIQCLLDTQRKDGTWDLSCPAGVLAPPLQFYSNDLNGQCVVLNAEHPGSDDARQEFRRAADLAREQRARLFELRALTGAPSSGDRGTIERITELLGEYGPDEEAFDVASARSAVGIPG